MLLAKQMREKVGQIYSKIRSHKLKEQPELWTRCCDSHQKELQVMKIRTGKQKLWKISCWFNSLAPFTVPNWYIKSHFMCRNIFWWGHFNTQPSSIHMNRVFIHASLLFAQRDFEACISSGWPSAHMWEVKAKVTYGVTYLYKIRVAAQVILASHQYILHEDFSESKICV